MAQPKEAGPQVDIFAVQRDRDPVEEQYSLMPLREIDLRRKSEMTDGEWEQSMQDITAFHKMLTDPENVRHFANPPLNPADLRRKLLHDGTHTYVEENRQGVIVSAGGINDAEPGQHDHFLVKVVAHPEYQGKKIGTKTVIKLTDTGFGTKTRDGRIRDKLDLAIIVGPDGWNRMEGIADHLGYQFRSRLPRQVDVGENRYPTVRYEIQREEWDLRRPMLAIKYNLPIDLPFAA